MNVPNESAAVKRRVMGRGDLYTPEELMVRLKFIIGLCLTATLMGIIFTILYSVIFVTQPLKAIAPIDQKFFEVIIPVASFLCGILSGIMLNSTNQQALDAMKQTMQTFKPPSPPPPEPVSAQTSAPVRKEPMLAEPPVVPVTTGFKGKLAPPAAPQPEIE